MKTEDDWKVLFEHLSTEGLGVSVRYQGQMTRRRLDLLMEILALTRNTLYSTVPPASFASPPVAAPSPPKPKPPPVKRTSLQPTPVKTNS